MAANAVSAFQPPRNSVSSAGPKPKNVVVFLERPARSRSCMIVAVTVDGALPRKYSARAQRSWSNEQGLSVLENGQAEAMANMHRMRVTLMDQTDKLDNIREGQPEPEDAKHWSEYGEV